MSRRHVDPTTVNWCDMRLYHDVMLFLLSRLGLLLHCAICGLRIVKKQETELSQRGRAMLRVCL